MTSHTNIWGIKWEFFFLQIHNFSELATWLDGIKNELLAANKLPLGYTACCFPAAKRRESCMSHCLQCMNKMTNGKRAWMLMKNVWLAIGSMKTSELFCKFKERLHMQLVSRIIDTKIELSEEADILFSCMSFGYFCISLSLIKTGATIWIQRKWSLFAWCLGIKQMSEAFSQVNTIRNRSGVAIRVRM